MGTNKASQPSIRAANGLDRVRGHYGDKVAAALDAVAQAARHTGLNLCHCFLPDEIGQISPGWAPFADSGNSLPGSPNGQNGLLLLLGNAGNGFWGALEEHYRSRAPEKPDAGFAASLQNGVFGTNPVDTFALDAVTSCLQLGLKEWLDAGDVRFEFLYPVTSATPAPREHAPLQKLGAAAGWHQSSPLGTGVHPEWGLWYAYRVLVKLSWSDEQAADFAANMGLPEIPAYGDLANAREGTGHSANANLTDICASCASKICISSCPGSALEFGKAPDMQACVSQRRNAGSTCADRCLAREACPVNQERQYPREQIEYHYRVALASLLEYFP